MTIRRFNNRRIPREAAAQSIPNDKFRPLSQDPFRYLRRRLSKELCLANFQYIYFLRLLCCHQTQLIVQSREPPLIFWSDILSFRLVTSLPEYQATSDCPSIGTFHISCWKVSYSAIVLSTSICPSLLLSILFYHCLVYLSHSCPTSQIPLKSRR
jgi:hypothetical protein